MSFRTWDGPQWKPVKGTAFKDRRDRRKQIVSAEESAKREVRQRDKSCRWPRCQYCRRYKPRLECAHITRAKGMGGDHGTVSKASDMMLLCLLAHGDEESNKWKRVIPLTKAGTNGPCSFWQKGEDGQFYLVAEETAIGVYRRD